MYSKAGLTQIYFFCFDRNSYKRDRDFYNLFYSKFVSFKANFIFGGKEEDDRAGVAIEQNHW